MSWTPQEEVEKRDAEIGIMDKLLKSQTALPACTEPNFESISQWKTSAHTRTVLSGHRSHIVLKATNSFFNIKRKLNENQKLDL